MAYKFQKGDFNASGSISVPTGSVTAGGDLSGSNINVTTVDITTNANLSSSVGGNFLLSEVTQSNAGVVFAEGNNVPVLIHEFQNPGNGGSMQFGSGSETANLLIRKLDDSDELFGLELAKGNTKHIKINSAASEGNVSASADVNFEGAGTFGELRVGGTLDVSGEIRAAATAVVQVTGSLVIDAQEGTRANVVNSALVFGDGSAHGGSLRFASGSTEEFHFKLMNGNNTAALDGAANLIGDGSALTGLGNAGSLSFGIVSKTTTASGQDAGATLEVNKINVISGVATNNNVRLPAVSGLTAGDIISFKLDDSAASATNYLKIVRNGTDDIIIEGETGADGIRITSPYASADIVYLGEITTAAGGGSAKHTFALL